MAKLVDSTEKINELYYIVQQAALYRITRSTLSISFELFDGDLFHIRVYILDVADVVERDTLKRFYEDIRKNFNQDDELFFELIEIQKDTDILNLDTLKWNFYLPKVGE